ncbi:tyrosine-type recombinase/integrase [Tateyamaria sp. ANG-S1]|uniref:tyrosine-type recombinase/integrase n=1 Tax=Tateyamaria sp. ANG-S1 TaxID=1577905 RepID=UPI0005803083|nr:tyrosine-type recombinase/integrase [Tateyamaria sp. ANG-S1]KIC46146.1 hypothetical protein RA29_20165 [Tateyamaria sp. ANG-S1]
MDKLETRVKRTRHFVIGGIAASGLLGALILLAALWSISNLKTAALVEVDTLRTLYASQPYKVTSFGNWFRDRCREAEVPGSIHGLRKAGATRLADAGASDWEIASYLAHTDTTQASVYTRAANRSKLADSGFEKLGKLSNSSKELDKQEG